MTIGILETGAPPRSLRGRFGDYATMFQALIGPERAYRVFDIAGGERPSSERPCAAYIVTGSDGKSLVIGVLRTDCVGKDGIYGAGVCTFGKVPPQAIPGTQTPPGSSRE